MCSAGASRPWATKQDARSCQGTTGQRAHGASPCQGGMNKGWPGTEAGAAHVHARVAQTRGGWTREARRQAWRTSRRGWHGQGVVGRGRRRCGRRAVRDRVAQTRGDRARGGTDAVAAVCWVGCRCRTHVARRDVCGAKNSISSSQPSDLLIPSSTVPNRTKLPFPFLTFPHKATRGEL